jgi:hypothetical protein
MIARDTYSVVRRLVPEGKTTCSVCSRLRRGVLYGAAIEMGCTKIALGHHRDDLVETLLLSALYSGALKSMPAKLLAKDGRNVVVRPLCYAAEEDVAAFAEAMRFPIVPCDLCGSQPNLRRRRVKELLTELSREHPAVKGNLLHALARVVRPRSPPGGRPGHGEGPVARRRRRGLRGGRCGEAGYPGLSPAAFPGRARADRMRRAWTSPAYGAGAPTSSPTTWCRAARSR